tara:strand:- start:4699 stop:6282 length:1584 start_codon:yes stop_codon:yes gene_type:complete
MKNFYIILTISLIVSTAKAQDFQIDWQNSIGGNDNDNLTILKATTDGGHIAGGLSLSNISGDKTENSLGAQDYWVVKMDASGMVEWDTTIGGNNLDQLIDLVPTNDGGYILAGSSNSNISGDKTENSIGFTDYWLVKLNATGAIEWQNTIGGSDPDFLVSVSETNDGGFFLAGYSRSNVSGDKTENSKGGLDYWVVKVSNLGEVQWDRTIGGDENEFLQAAIQTIDGGFLFGGVSYSNASGDKSENRMGVSDFWLVKLNASGQLEWENTIGGDGADVLTSIIEATDGGFVIGGESDSDISGDKTEDAIGETDMWVLKTDNTGNVLWQNTIGGNEEEIVNSIEKTADGGFILGGFSNSNISGDKTEDARGSYDFWIVKIKDTGTIQWDKTIGGSEDDRLHSIYENNSGGYVLGGYSFSDISGDKTESSVGGADYWIMELSEVLGIEDTSVAASAVIFPNPVHENVRISLDEGLIDEIKVYSLKGQMLKELNALNTNSVSLDISEFTSGAYFLQILSEGTKTTKKLIKI